MKQLHQNLNVPVFYHIPKNAGTYVISIIFNYLRYFITDSLHEERRLPTYITPRNIVIQKNNVQLARILGYDPNNFCGENKNFKKANSNDETLFFLELDKLNENLISHINVFTLVIEGDGFKFNSEICKHFYQYSLKRFIILRDPAKRALSFFNYINSNSAKHEPTHGMIPNNFSGYINSHFLEDSWLIRQFAKISDDQEINESHYDAVYNKLKYFDVSDIENTDKFLIDFFLKYLNLPNELSASSKEFISPNHGNLRSTEVSDADTNFINEKFIFCLL